jgi:glycosyltransferase involved in cell wall biosynthesis
VSDAPSIPANSHAIVITEVIEMGGAERSCLALARWLYEHRMPVHFVTYEDKVGLERFATHPLAVVQLKPQMDARHKIAAMKQYFAAHSSAPLPLMSGYQPVLHATLGGMRGFHCLMHDTPSLFSDAGEQASLRRRLSRWVSDKIVSRGLKTGGSTIVTSEYLKAETMRVFGVEAAIARMGGLSQENAFHLRPVKDHLRMLSVSRIEGNKRIDWMVRALATMEQGANPLSAQIDWRLDVTGKGSQLEAMRALAAELGVGDRIIFHGFVSDEELQRLYDGAELFLMPAVQGYGIPAIEALSRGIPVLLHRESGVSDILLHTPWATVMEGGEETMVSVLQTATSKVIEGTHLKAPLPDLPTEDSWAAEVARLCRWS